MRILYHHNAGPWLRRQFEQLAADGLTVTVCPVPDRTGLERRLPEAEILWHVLEPVTADMLARAPKLLLIQKIGVGVNTIDLAAAEQASIPVCNMPGTNTRAVAEHALALMLAALRCVPAFDRATRAGSGWDQPPEVYDGLGEIGGKRVGLVGFGAVPQILAPILTAMGAQVAYTARSAKDTAATRLPLEQLLAESDILSLHLPLTAETERLIDAKAIAAMKPGAILINTARGSLVDQAGLHDALARGHLSAAGLDVFAEEPVSPADPLLQLPNVVTAPHIAWLTRETMARSIAVGVENCRRLVAGEPLLHQVA